MDRKSRSFWRRVVTWVLMPVTAAALAEERPRPLEGGEKVRVAFTVFETFTSGATSALHTIPFDLSLGQTAVGDAMHGTPFSFGVAGDPSGCGSQSGFQSAESLVAQYAVAWSADARVLEASTDRLVLSASWRRFARGSDGKPTESASEQIPSFSLREGDRVLLDFVHTPGSRCFRNAALEITAQVREDPAFASRQIAYELWLVHEMTDGRKTVERTQLTASQGERLPFAFSHQKVPALASGGTADQKLQVAITGQVRGRIRSDGTLALSLATNRTLSYVATDGSSDGEVGEGGRKTVDIRPGEAIRVELPDPSQGAPRGDPRAPRMAQDLEGHSFAVVLSARPLS
jgi:hypothetical protein